MYEYLNEQDSSTVNENTSTHNDDKMANDGSATAYAQGILGRDVEEAGDYWSQDFL